jgi:hypothetical protein
MISCVDGPLSNQTNKQTNTIALLYPFRPGMKFKPLSQNFCATIDIEIKLPIYELRCFTVLGQFATKRDIYTKLQWTATRNEGTIEPVILRFPFHKHPNRMKMAIVHYSLVTFRGSSVNFRIGDNLNLVKH